MSASAVVAVGFVDRARPWAGAIALHAVIVAALATGLVKSPPPPVQTLGIEAVVVDEQLIAVQQAGRRQAADAEARRRAAERAREAEAQRQRELAGEQAEAQRARDVAREQAAVEARAREATASSKAAAARSQAATQARMRAEAKAQAKAAADAHARAAAEAKARAEVESQRRATAADARRAADLKAGLAAEESQRQGDVAKASLRQRYAALIKDRVERNWRRPPGAQAGLTCTLFVGQIPGGEVTSVRVGDCVADAAVRQSIIDAVYRASPLPAPPDPALFERNLVLEFVPQE